MTDLGKVLPWGLTVGQTLCIGIGGFMLLGGWTIATSSLRLGKNILMCGLAAILMVMCCASTVFVAYHFTH
jgi:hypothetical protein